MHGRRHLDGVFCDQPELVNAAIDAYKNGFPLQHTMPSVKQYIDATGQCAESGRDQPHTQGGLAHLVETAAVAFNQGTNLFTYGDNRLLLGLEYTAKYNLGKEVPSHPFVDFDGKLIYPKGIITITPASARSCFTNPRRRKGSPR